MKVWGWVVATAVAVGMGQGSTVQAQDFLCNFAPNLPFCDDNGGDGDLQDQIDELVEQNETQAGQISALSAAIALQAGAIAELNADIDALEGEVAALEAAVGELALAFDDCDSFGLAECEGDCVNTESDEENCGSCGFECASNQDCSEGSCVLRTCPPSTDCRMYTLLSNGTCAASDTPDETVCDDGPCAAAGVCNDGICVTTESECGEDEQCVQGPNDENGLPTYTCEPRP